MVWNIWIIFPYIGNSNPNWLSYFSEGLKPPTSVELSCLLLISPAWQEFVFSYWELLATCKRCFLMIWTWPESGLNNIPEAKTAVRSCFFHRGHCFVACCLSEMRYLYFPFWGCIWSWPQTISGLAAASEAKHWWAHFYCRNLDQKQNSCIYQWPFQEPKLEVPTIYKAYFSGLNFREYPHWIYQQYINNNGLPDISSGLAFGLGFRVHIGGSLCHHSLWYLGAMELVTRPGKR